MKSTSNDFKPYLDTMLNFIVYLFGVCGFIIIAYLFNKAGLSDYKVSLLAISIIAGLIILCNHQLRKFAAKESLLSKIELANPVIFILFILFAHLAVITVTLLVGDLIAMTLDYSPDPLSLKDFLDSFLCFLSTNYSNMSLIFLSYYLWFVGILCLIPLIFHKSLKDVSSLQKTIISITCFILSIFVPIAWLLLSNLIVNLQTLLLFLLLFTLACILLYYLSRLILGDKILPALLLIAGAIWIFNSCIMIYSLRCSNELNSLLFWFFLGLLSFFIIIISIISLIIPFATKIIKASESLPKACSFINFQIIPIIVIILSISVGSILLNYVNKLTTSAQINLFYLSLTIVAVMVFFPFVLYTFIQIPYYLYSFLEKLIDKDMGRRKKQEIVNIHCHLLNSDYVPDSYLSSLIPSDFPFSFSKRILRLPLLVDFIEKFVLFLPMETDKRTADWIKLISRKMLPDRFTNRKERPESDWSVAEVYLDEMEQAREMKMAVPLLMDLNEKSYNTNPDVDYMIQIDEISKIAGRYPFKLMPFVMFDPRRNDAMGIVTNALENQGFLGVKLYPSMGYDLDYEFAYNSKETNDALMQIYAYCAKNQIPITIHSAAGGNTAETISARKEIRDGYSDPAKWTVILARPQYNTTIGDKPYNNVDLKTLILNLAHFGGDLHEEQDKNDLRCKVIKDLLCDSEAKNIYTDVACNLLDLTEEKIREKYFSNLESALKDPSCNRKIMFGTDWMMTRRTYKEKDFADEYIEFFDNNKGLKSSEDDFFVLNALRFLFPLPPNPPLPLPFPQNSGKYGRIPDRIAKFYFKSYKSYTKDMEDNVINSNLPEDKKVEILKEIGVSENSNVGGELKLFYHIYMLEEKDQNRTNDQASQASQASQVIDASEALKSLGWLIRQFAKI